jgi:hypothetical protein
VAPDLAAEKKVIGVRNQATTENVVYIPLRFLIYHRALRTNVFGIVEATFPAVWDVGKA